MADEEIESFSIQYTVLFIPILYNWKYSVDMWELKCHTFAASF